MQTERKKTIQMSSKIINNADSTFKQPEMSFDHSFEIRTVRSSIMLIRHSNNLNSDHQTKKHIQTNQ